MTEVSVTTYTTDENISITSIPRPAGSLPQEYTLYTFLGCLGFLDNAFVIFVILSYKPMRDKMANIYIINQSMLDMVGSFIFLLSLDDRINSRKFNGAFGDVYCKVWKTAALLWGCFIGSTINLTVIALDRYAEIVHPLWHKARVTKQKMWIVLVAVWLFGMVYSLTFNVATSGMRNGVSTRTISFLYIVTQSNP